MKSEDLNSQAVPFFARFLEGQNGEDLSDQQSEVISGGQTLMTQKYPSDSEEHAVTQKYPSDSEDGDVVTKKCHSNHEHGGAVTLKYPSDGDEILIA